MCSVWRRFRRWWFRTFQFQPNRFYGNWWYCTEELDQVTAEIIAMKDAYLYVPEKYMGRVKVLVSPKWDIPSDDPLLAYPTLAWKYVPEKKG